MEQNNEQSIFGLNMDSQSKSFLRESAKWGKFLAIIGFIMCVFIVLAGIFVATQTSELNKAFGDYGGNNSVALKGFGPMMAVVYIIIAIIYFFPCLYLLRFSNHMKAALDSDDQANLTMSFQNLKSMFKFMGIFTIILISIYLLALVAGIAAGI